MNKSYLKQMVNYFFKVYHLGEKINIIKDKKIKLPVKVSTITFVVLFGFILQIRSFNRLKHWLEKDKLKKVLTKKTNMTRIDAVRRCLSDFDLGGLKSIHNDIIKTKYTKVKAWDEDNFEIADASIKVRFIKFLEEILTEDITEIKEAWIITTDKSTLIEPLLKIIPFII